MFYFKLNQSAFVNKPVLPIPNLPNKFFAMVFPMFYFAINNFEAHIYINIPGVWVLYFATDNF